jgi:glycosyltransferase involved in cell wall biosynthesis
MRQLEKLPKGKYLVANDPNNGLAELRLPKLLNAAGAKIVYSPFFVMGTLGKRYRLVLTIHDMIYFKHRTPPQWLPWLTRLGWRLFHLTYWPMRWQLNRAQHVATVSETARNELLEARATKRTVTAVCNAVGQQFIAPDQDHFTKNVVIYMGAFTPYKNVECLIDAIMLTPDAVLHLCSKIPAARRTSLERYIEQAGATSRVVLHNGVTDSEYKTLLADARCAISASRVEGFGLPLIEAQQAGVPFIAADTPIFREIGADSVLYFNPDSPQEAAAHIRILSNTNKSKHYVRLGRTNAARYTWGASARSATAIIHDVASDTIG